MGADTSAPAQADRPRPQTTTNVLVLPSVGDLALLLLGRVHFGNAATELLDTKTFGDLAGTSRRLSLALAG